MPRFLFSHFCSTDPISLRPTPRLSHHFADPRSKARVDEEALFREQQFSPSFFQTRIPKQLPELHAGLEKGWGHSAFIVLLILGLTFNAQKVRYHLMVPGVYENIFRGWPRQAIDLAGREYPGKRAPYIRI